jgi:arylsulfatase A-like enzyme
MPQLDRLTSQLAGEGASFENFFVPISSCGPSRATFLRGQYAHNHGVLANGGPRGGFLIFNELNLQGSTIATWLQSGGYKTGFLGKFMNGYPGGDDTYVPPGWDDWHAFVSAPGFFDYTLNENGETVAYTCCDDHATDVLTSKATAFIRREASNESPFFLYISTFAPHKPADPALRHSGAFAEAQAPRLPSFNEEDVSDKPRRVANRPLLTQEDIDWIDELARQRLRTMLSVQDMLDSLLTTLESVGALDETYILFVSDNGYHLGLHRLRSGKFTAYDEDIRVPLYVRGPGIRQKNISAFALATDIAPTLADLAGVTPQGVVDGRSLVPLLLGTGSLSSGGRRAVLIERWETRAADPKPEWPAYRAVRTPDYLYVELGTGEIELYDRRTDPYELRNLSSGTSPQLIESLSAWADQLSACSGSACRAAEDFGN